MPPFLLADVDPMSAIPLVGSLKGLATYGLVAIAGLALFAPTAWNKLKAALLGLVEDQLKDRLPKIITDNLPQPDAASKPELAKADSVAEPTLIVRQRAAALKAACPAAPLELRMKWIEQGFDPARAQADYISVLESQLAEKGGSLPRVV